MENKKLFSRLITEVAHAKVYKLKYTYEAINMLLLSSDEIPNYITNNISDYISIEEIHKLPFVNYPILQIVSSENWNSQILDEVFDMENKETIQLQCERQGWKYKMLSSDFPLYVKTVEESIEYLIWDNDHIVIIGDLNKLIFQSDIIRMIRVILEVVLMKNNYLKLHMGVLGFNNKGYGFCSEKGGGKTTLLCRILQMIENSYFTTNDKAFLKITDGKIDSLGIPQRIGVKEGTMSRYPELKEISTYSNNGNTYFWIKELCGYFNRDVLPNIEISCIIVPSIKIGSKKFKIRKINKDEITILLKMNVFEFSDRVNPNWLKKYIINEDSYKKKLVIDLSKINLSIPWYYFEGDPWCNEFESNILKFFNKEVQRD